MHGRKVGVMRDLPQLQSNADTPLYLQLKEWMLERIRNRSFDPDAALPSERLLMSELKISRATVRQAIDALEREGWVERQHGRGTFVNSQKVEQPAGRLSGFSQNMRLAGLTPSSKLVSARLEDPEDKVASLLNLMPGQVVAAIERVRLADDEPLMLERSFLNYRFVPKLLEHDLSGSLYELLTVHYRLELSAGEESIEVLAADAALGEKLNIDVGDAVLYTERLVTDGEGHLLEFAQRYARADKCKFRVTLTGHTADFVPKAS